MGKLGGAALKVMQTLLYALTFCCAALILALYSYFLATQSTRDLAIPTWQKAVEGISGAGVLYSIFAVVLTCCLGGKSFFAFVAIVLDLAFTAGFIAVAVLTRDATRSCTADTVYTPLGRGDPDSEMGSRFLQDTRVGAAAPDAYSITLHTACVMNKAVFAVAIIGAFLFLIATFFQLFLGRNHRREKRYGPSPANNYTSGSPKRRFWQRRSGPRTTHGARDAEVAAAGGLVAEKHHHGIRPSHDTAFTGSTVGAPTATYDSHGKPVNSANPYGYDNVRNSAANY